MYYEKMPNVTCDAHPFMVYKDFIRRDFKYLTSPAFTTTTFPVKQCELRNRNFVMAQGNTKCFSQIYPCVNIAKKMDFFPEFIG